MNRQEFEDELRRERLRRFLADYIMDIMPEGQGIYKDRNTNVRLNSESLWQRWQAAEMRRGQPTED